MLREQSLVSSLTLCYLIFSTFIGGRALLHYISSGRLTATFAFRLRLLYLTLQSLKEEPVPLGIRKSTWYRPGSPLALSMLKADTSVIRCAFAVVVRNFLRLRPSGRVNL